MTFLRSLPAAATLVTLLGVASIGCTIQAPGTSSGGSSKTNTSSSSSSGGTGDETSEGDETSSAEPAADGPVVATMHAAELVREFQTNAVRANELYAGKRVRVFGTVNSVDQDDDKIALVFKTSVTTTAHLFCRFTTDRASSLSSLSTGDDATADGTVVGISGFTNGRLVLENCSTP